MQESDKSVRILIVDHYYNAVINWIYRRDPGLAREDYATQRARIDDALFGQTAFQVAGLRRLGHEAWDSLVNVRPLQEAWAREHAAPLSPPTRWGLGRRRRWVPWPRRLDTQWMGQALLAQVRHLKPDVVHIQSMDLLTPEIVADVRREVRFVVGQIAAELPTDWNYSSYDLIVSSIPDLVDRFRREGGDAEQIPLAFEPSLLERIPPAPRDIPVSFIGSFSRSHATRVEVVGAVARVAPLHTWTGDVGALPTGSPIRPTVKGIAWGGDMYKVLGRSRLTVNNHARIAGRAANNLRLFEATGMGALLVTEARSNLGDLFDVGREVATYVSPQECAEVVRHYLENPQEANAIALAGQERTLRNHTWRDRMERLVRLIQDRI
jgi:spore maturation protein CgeB